MAKQEGWMLYGSYGYTGELILAEATRRGLKPILAGRDRAKVEKQARAHGLEARVFPMDDAEKIASQLEGVKAVLHCAGPFVATAGKMAHACLMKKVHYLDVTGEVLVFESLALMDEAAKKQGVSLMPGVGFDVVPTDCLAAHLKRALPTANRLLLGFEMTHRDRVAGKKREPGSRKRVTLSRGTMKTVVENLHRGSLIRENGILTPVPVGHGFRQVDYGRGPKDSVAIPWGDVSTAFHSTGIPNIAVYGPMPRLVRYLTVVTRPFTGILGTRFVQDFLRKRVDAAPAGPPPEDRETGVGLIWGRVEDPAGASHETRLVTPEGYTLTAMTAVEALFRVLDGQVAPGFMTPSKAFGPDFITGFPGVERKEA